MAVDAFGVAVDDDDDDADVAVDLRGRPRLRRALVVEEVVVVASVLEEFG